MSQVILILGPVIGFIGMMSGGYWGVGCGWIIVPAMLIMGFDPLSAVGIGLLQMAPSTLLTVIRQAPEIGWGRGEPGLTLALPIGIGALVTSLCGKGINRALIDYFGDARPLQWLLIGIIVIVAIQTLFGSTVVSANQMPEIGKGRQRMALGFGALTGFISSLLGIGGGLIIRPLLTTGFRVPEYYTSRIVRFLVLVTSMVGGATYLVNSDHFDWRIFNVSMLIAAGGIIGFPCGVKLHRIVFNAGYAQHIHKSFAVVAIAMLLNTLLNMYGFSSLSRLLMLGIGVGLSAYLVIFAIYARNNPGSI